MRSKNALFLNNRQLNNICVFASFPHYKDSTKSLYIQIKNLFGGFIYIYYLCIVDLRERGCEGKQD